MKAGRMEGHDYLNEARLMWDGDAWGAAMHAWFTAAEELYSREGWTPDHWRFRQSPLGNTNDPDDNLTGAAKECGAHGLEFAGNVLYRYLKRLKAAGLDY